MFQNKETGMSLIDNAWTQRELFTLKTVLHREGSPTVQIQVSDSSLKVVGLGKLYHMLIQSTTVIVSGKATYKLVGAIRFVECGMGLNHYTAFIRSSLDPTQWFHIDDSVVSSMCRAG